MSFKILIMKLYLIDTYSDFRKRKIMDSVNLIGGESRIISIPDTETCNRAKKDKS